MKQFFKDLIDWRKNLNAALPALITGLAIFGCIIAVTMPPG